MKDTLPDIRQTYFIMFEENGVRYIFNRSIRWNSILCTKNIEKLINVLGKEAIDNFIIKLNNTENNLCNKVNELTNKFVVDDTVFTILEVHPEWKNFGREDQWDKIEPRKDELCKIWDAVKRRDQLANTIEIDKQIGSILKRKFKQWLIDIYDAIIEYANFVNDGIVHTSLGATIESLKQQIKHLESQRIKLVNEINVLHNDIKNNKETLRKQNYVIDAYNRYFNNLDDNELEVLKKTIIKNNENTCI